MARRFPFSYKHTFPIAPTSREYTRWSILRMKFVCNAIQCFSIVRKALICKRMKNIFALVHTNSFSRHCNSLTVSISANSKTRRKYLWRLLYAHNWTRTSCVEQCLLMQEWGTCTDSILSRCGLLSIRLTLPTAPVTPWTTNSVYLPQVVYH